jgi:hypothetical protein
MHFSEVERQAMLKLNGVGETVIGRLEQIGFCTLAELKHQNPGDITKQISEMMGSTCWHNSPQAKRAIQAVINLAQQDALH